MAGPGPEPVQKPTPAPPPQTKEPAPDGDKTKKRELGGLGHAAAEDRLRPESVPDSTPKSTPVDDAELRRRAEANIDEVRAGAQAFGTRLETLTATFASPPTFAQMQELDALLQSFEEDIGRWRVLALQIDQRLVTGPTAEWTGPDFLGQALRELRDAFQSAVKAFQGGVDTRNDTEIRREAALARKPREKGKPDERLRVNAGKEPLGDRDWLPLYIPGMRVKRNAQTNSTAGKSGARDPEQIKSAVVHTGGYDNQGTLNTLTGKGLAGHFSVDGSGTTEQTNPVSQTEVHAEVANKTSIAIDLAYGLGASGESTGELAFLGSSKQMLSAARILVAQDRVSPEVVGTTNTRGALTGAHLGEAAHMEGGSGTVMEVRDGSRMGDSITGIVAHQDLPDSDHSDPGGTYMQRLQAFIPVLKEYERRYGPIEVDEPAELERVVAVIERYEEKTGRAAAGISLREGRLRVAEEMAALEVKKKALRQQVTEAERVAVYRAVYKSMVSELLDDVDPKERRERSRTVSEEVARELPDADIHFDVSAEAQKIVVDHLLTVVTVPPEIENAGRRKYVLEHATQAQKDEARGLQTYTDAAATYPRRVRGTLVEVIVRDRELAERTDDNLAAFRDYLAVHLPELLKP